MKEIDEVIKDDLNHLVDRCYGDAKRAGWHSRELTPETEPLMKSTQLMLIVSEIAEAMEGLRKNRMDDHLPNRKQEEVELADAIIRICDYAGKWQLDLGGAVAEKLEYNKYRLDHKPENRAKEGGKNF